MKILKREKENLCVSVRVRVYSVLTVPIPKVVISCPSLFNAKRMFSLMSLLATIDKDLSPSDI